MGTLTIGLVDRMPVDPCLDPFALGVLLIDQSPREVHRQFAGELHSLLIANRLFVEVQSTMPFYVVDILVRLSISFDQLKRENKIYLVDYVPKSFYVYPLLSRVYH